MNQMTYDLTGNQFKLMLKNMKNILLKSKKWAEPKKIDLGIFFGLRLAPDMLPMGKQIQIATDIAKGCLARMSRQTAPVFEDNEQTFDQFINRIEKTIGFIESVKPEQLVGFETIRAEFPWVPGKHLMGNDFLIQHAIPNFYFHVTAVYAILRANGVDLGKGDFLGEQNWKTNS